MSSARWLLLALGLAASASPRLEARASAGDWTQFGWDVASSGASADPTGHYDGQCRLVAAAPSHSRRHGGRLRDLSARRRGQRRQHDVFFVTTTYGKTIAIDADRGSVLWEYTPPKLADWEGSRQITNSTPAADPDRKHIYAAAPDGTIQKLAVADGHVLWTTSITQLPAREKIASPLREFRGRIIAVTTGYIGDTPPYQGHVAILDAQSGKLLHVWNSLCSDRPRTARAERLPLRAIRHLGPRRRGHRRGDGRYLRRHGQRALQRQDRLGRFDHRARHGCDPDARQLHARPTTASSTSGISTSARPHLRFWAAVSWHRGARTIRIRLLDLQDIAGATPHRGHERQILSTPSGGRLFTAPAVWRNEGTTWMFAADGGGTAAWTLEGGKLVERWKNGNGGTSPVIAGGLLYIYDAKGKLRIYEPTTGDQVANLGTGSGHWNSPIVVDGRIALPEGNANGHASSGVLDIWTLPAGK